MVLGARIRQLRERAGLTLEEAGRPFLSPSGLSKIESGASSPSMRVMIALARRLREHGVTKGLRGLIPPGL